MTVRGPPGPPGPPGRGWLDTSFAPGGSCGCNETLLRLYVQVRVRMMMMMMVVMMVMMVTIIMFRTSILN